MSTPDASETLPLFDWAEGMTLQNPKGGKALKRWGRVSEASRILGCDREVIYDLVRAGLVEGYKLNPARPNSHFRVDLLSVWRHRERAKAEIRGA